MLSGYTKSSRSSPVLVHPETQPRPCSTLQQGAPPPLRACVPLASSIPASQPAALWRPDTFKVPTAVPHTHFPSTPHPSRASSQKPACAHKAWLPACCPLSILPPWAYSQPKTRPSSRIPDRACVAPTTWQEGDMFAHARAGAAVPLLSQLRQSVPFTNQEQHGPVHTSRNLSSQRCLCSPMAPLLGCTFGGIANASGMLRVPCRMRQTANVIVAASHPQITERLHPPFWPRLQLDTTLLRPCVEGAARCRGVPRTHVTHAAVLHRAGYQPQGTAYIDKRLDARRPHPRIEPAARVTFFSA